MDYEQMFYDCAQVIHRKITNLPIRESRKSQCKPKQCVFTILLYMQHSASLLQIEFTVIGYVIRKGLVLFKMMFLNQIFQVAMGRHWISKIFYLYLRKLKPAIRKALIIKYRYFYILIFLEKPTCNFWKEWW